MAFTAADIKERLQGNTHGRTTFLERYDQLLEEVDARVGVDLTRRSAQIYHQPESTSPALCGAASDTMT